MKFHKNFKRLFIAWLILVHVIILLMVRHEAELQFFANVMRLKIIPKPELTSYYHQKRTFLQRAWENQAEGTALFIGDSRIEGLNVSAVRSGATNLGIGGDTSFGVLNRIGDYAPFSKVDFVVLAVGLNDLKYRHPDEIAPVIEKVVAVIGNASPVFILSVIPVDDRVANTKFSNESIDQVNAMLVSSFAANPTVTVLDVGRMLAAENGSLRPGYHIGDGVHLNHQGKQVLIEKLIAMLPE